MALRTAGNQKKLNNLRPLILIGMHRSGTSLMARLLIDCGLHMGSRLSINAEDIFFRRLNERLLTSAGAHWSRMDPLADRMISRPFREKQADILKDWLIRKRFLKKSLGKSCWQDFNQGGCLRWGWKDPRSTITFPVWQAVFPEARFLYVARNGIDVAISLHRRALKNQQWWKKISPIHFYSERMLEFSECFKLWEEYSAFFEKWKFSIPKDALLTVKYENLLENPMEALDHVLSFIDLQMPKSETETICRQVNRSRLDNSVWVNQYRDAISELPEDRLRELNIGLPFK